MNEIDLRWKPSRPTPEMMAAISAAELGDDVWGDDPTVIRLQALASRILAKPAACLSRVGPWAI